MDLLPKQQDAASGILDSDLPSFESDDHLYDPANLETFPLWYQMRGYERVPTIQEICDLDAVVAHDFGFLLKQLRQLEQIHTLDTDW